MFDLMEPSLLTIRRWQVANRPKARCSRESRVAIDNVAAGDIIALLARNSKV